MTKKFWRYFLVNTAVVIACIVLFFHDFYGENQGFAYDILGAAILIALPIIVFQYKLLLLASNWLYKALVYYIGMVAFLFLFGIVFGWNEEVGSNEAGTWLARLDSGFRFAIMGQLFGGLLAYPVILLANLALKDWIFEKKKKSLPQPRP